MTFDANRLPKKLVEEYREGRCAIFVGAGASQAAGYRGWDSLLAHLIDRGVEENLILEEEERDFRSLVGVSGKQLMLASAIKEKLSTSWDEIISETFADDRKDPVAVHKSIVQLDRSTMIITTNYDLLLEDAFQKETGRQPSVLTFRDAGEIRRLMLLQKFFILKAHGDASKPGNGIILTTKDYRQLIQQERAYQSLLASAFTLRTILFVGASLNDPEVTMLLDFLADAFSHGTGPMHYALVPDDEINAVERERWRKDYHVHVIEVSPKDDYAEVPQALSALKEAVAT